MRYILLTVALVGTGVLATSFATGSNLASVFSATSATARACTEALIAVHGTALTADDIALTEANITTSGSNDYIARLTSDAFCGTNGCVYELCTTNSSGEAQLINFGYAGTSLAPAGTYNDGMVDLLLNDEFRLTWTDGQYTIAE